MRAYKDQMCELANNDQSAALRTYMAMAERIRYLLRYNDDPQRTVPREPRCETIYDVSQRVSRGTILVKQPF